MHKLCHVQMLPHSSYITVGTLLTRSAAWQRKYRVMYIHLHPGHSTATVGLQYLGLYFASGATKPARRGTGIVEKLGSTTSPAKGAPPSLYTVPGYIAVQPY